MNLKLFLLLILLTTARCAFSQTHRDEFGLQSDNDAYLLGGLDSYYTDGLFFHDRHALKIKNDRSSLQNKVLGFELGQKIFNPQTGNIPGAEYVDRPFAGYLYISSTLNFLYKNESNLKIGAQVGIIGPGAAGEEVQKFVHNTFGFYPINGWQWQIRNAFQLNLSAEYNKLLTRGKLADLSLSTYANLGTGFTGAGLGPLFRFGNFNQLFNSASTQSTTIAGSSITQLHRHEFFFHYKPQLNYIGYDATIQGGLFNDRNKIYTNNNREVVRDPERFIFTNQLGISYTADRWVLDYSATFPTREVKNMIYGHQWASISATYRFN